MAIRTGDKLIEAIWAEMCENSNEEHISSEKERLSIIIHYLSGKIESLGWRLGIQGCGHIIQQDSPIWSNTGR